MAKTVVDILAGAIFDKTLETLQRPSVPVDNANATTVAGQVTQAIKPVLANATNSEPWYKSRIFIGLGVSAIGFLAGKLGYVVSSQDATLVIDIVTQIIQAFGLLYATYGRIVGAAKPPLGDGSK